MYRHYEEDKYMSKVITFQEEMEELVLHTLQEAGLSPTHLWAEDHVLEVYLPNMEEYKEAMEIMRLECPTEAQSFFGKPGDECGHLMVFQFDSI